MKKNTENWSSYIFWHGAGIHKHFPGFLKRGGGGGGGAGHAPSMATTVFFFGVFFIFVGALVYTGWIDAVSLTPLWRLSSTQINPSSS